MEKRLTYVLENATLTARKVNVLLQTHFSREPVPADLASRRAGGAADGGAVVARGCEESV